MSEDRATYNPDGPTLSKHIIGEAWAGPTWDVCLKHNREFAFGEKCPCCLASDHIRDEAARQVKQRRYLDQEAQIRLATGPQDMLCDFPPNELQDASVPEIEHLRVLAERDRWRNMACGFVFLFGVMSCLFALACWRLNQGLPGLP